ncbi:MAG: penicillin-binding protein 2 [Nitrococcus sp.]|nr:penicillin-binding protein 2 [Nitrococcus sp.]
MALPHLNDRLYSRIIRGRLAVAFLGMLVLSGALIGRLGYLQIAGYQHYRTLSQNNRLRLQAVAPTRGLIYDRNGILLAENRASFRLALVPEQVEDLRATLQGLARLVALRPTDLEQFHALLEHAPSFQEIPLKFDLSEIEVARFAVNRQRFPGVEVKAHLTRFYPQGKTAVHAVGYVGRINERELRHVDPAQYQPSSYIGKTGIERYYEDLLHGSAGLEHVETNALGRVIRSISRTASTPGRDLYLTLDLHLQRVAAKALGKRSGAVVAMDPSNGEILAFVSRPAYDPNLFVNGISLENYKTLQTNRDQPLFNRALRGQYPPGSTIKPFIGLAGLELGARQPNDTIYCPGHFSLPGSDYRWNDWKGHGRVNFKQAIAQSCDVYFYGLAYDLGIDAIHDSLQPFGFGEPTGIDLVGEHSGLLPSKQWKRRVKGKPWYPGETVNTGIGQGYLLTTPLQLAYATALLANRGQPIVAHLARASRAPGQSKLTAVPLLRAPGAAIALTAPEHWDQVTQAMVAAIHGPHGTARSVGAGASYVIAGKTGTAQVFGLEHVADVREEDGTIAEELRDHALFIAFAPADAPRIAVAVVVENGGSGGAVAGPIARQVMDAWLLD